MKDGVHCDKNTEKNGSHDARITGVSERFTRECRDGVGPCESFDGLGTWRWSSETDHDIDEAAQAEHPPGLHEKTDAELITQQTSASDHRKVDNKSSNAHYEAANERGNRGLICTAFPEDSEKEDGCDGRSEIRGNNVDGCKDAGKAGSL